MSEQVEEELYHVFVTPEPGVETSRLDIIGKSEEDVRSKFSAPEGSHVVIMKVKNVRPTVTGLYEYEGINGLWS